MAGAGLPVHGAVMIAADIAIGNLIGSNTFTLPDVAGGPVLIRPSGFTKTVLSGDFPVMIALWHWMGWMVIFSADAIVLRGVHCYSVLLAIRTGYLLA